MAMDIELVTGKTGKNHVTSQQMAILQSAIGTNIVLPAYTQFELRLNQDTNPVISVGNGYGLDGNGRMMGLDKTSSLYVDKSLLPAYLVCRYAISGNIEKATMEVVQNPKSSDLVLYYLGVTRDVIVLYDDLRQFVTPNISSKGWTPLTINSSNFRIYSGASYNVLAKKDGNVVNINAILSPQNATILANGSVVDVLNELLPEEFRPTGNSITTLHQGSARNVFITTISTSGAFQLGRYRVGDSYPTSVPNNTWLPINITYIV